MVYEIRKAARQFAMLYFHFCKTLYDTFGPERTKELVRQTIFELAVDRSDEMRAKAEATGVCFDAVKDFRSVTDLPKCGWIPEWGADHCPYGQVWRGNKWGKYLVRELGPSHIYVICPANKKKINHLTFPLPGAKVGNQLGKADHGKLTDSRSRGGGG